MCNRKVAIIGGGAGGLISASVLRKSGFDVTIYEQNDYIGGVWNYEESESLSSQSSSVAKSDKQRIPKSNPMFQGLRTNLPKEIMAFNLETPFPDHLPSFITHHDVNKYLNEFYRKNDLADCTRLSTEVIECVPNDGVDDDMNQLVENQSTSTAPLMPSLSPSSSSRSWLIKSRSLITHTIAFESFDYVVICNGHYNEPFTPSHDIENSDRFQGKQIHSREYDIPTEFAGQRVLVVGARSSGTDIARELNTCSAVTAVHVSDRNYVHVPPQSQTDDNGSNSNSYSTSVTTDRGSSISHIASSSSSSCAIHNHSGIKRFIANTKQVEFYDGSVSEVDVVIWCTGFLYHYPFLKTTITATPFSNNSPTPYKRTRKVSSLYQQLFFIPRPSLAFIGLPWAVVPFPLFYIQALTVCKVFLSMHISDSSNNNTSRSSLLPSQAAMYDWLTAFERHKTSTSITMTSSTSTNSSNNGESSTAMSTNTSNSARLNIDDGKYHYLGGGLQFDYMRELLSWITVSNNSSDVNATIDSNKSIQPFNSDNNTIDNDTLLKYLQSLQEIYSHVSQHRPSYVGAPDSYRDYQYHLDRVTMKWAIIIPVNNGDKE